MFLWLIMLYLFVYKLFRCMYAGAEDTFPIEFGVKIDTFPMKFGGKIDTFPILCREKGAKWRATCLGAYQFSIFMMRPSGSNLPARSAFFTQTPQEFFFTQA